MRQIKVRHCVLFANYCSSYIVHKKLKTVTMILHALQQIIQALKGNVELVGIQGNFFSDLDTLLGEAWVEQEAIGWDKVLKGLLSKNWG